MANVIDISGGMTGTRTGLTAQELLARELLKGNRGPSYGVGDSLSRLASQLGGAFFAKQGEERRAEQESRAARALGEAAALTAGGRPGGLQSTGGTGGDQVADVPTVSPGLAGLQEALRVHAGNPAVARSLPTLLQIAQASEKQAPKAPTLTEIYDDQGRPQKGYMRPDGTFSPVGGAKVEARARPLTQEEKATYGIPADAVAQMKGNGEVNVVFKPPKPETPTNAMIHDFTVGPNKKQTRISYDRGRTWQDQGEPFAARDDILPAPGTDANGLPTTTFYSRDQVASQLAGQQAGQAPGQAGQPPPSTPLASVSPPGKPPTPDQAAKKSLINQARQDFDTAMGVIFKGGDPDKSALNSGVISGMEASRQAQGGLPIVGGSAITEGIAGLAAPEGQRAFKSLVRALTTRQFLVSGAAVPETEVVRSMQQYLPRPGDPEAVLRDKMRSLKRMFDELAPQSATTPQGESSGVPAPPPGFTVVE